MTPLASAKQKLVLEFNKMQGAGNDFVVIDNRFYRFDVKRLSLLAKLLCRRKQGIGADGFLALDPPPEEEEVSWDYRFRYFNSDGSVGRMCGNGARCLARFAMQAGFSDARLTFLTDAGIFEAEASTQGEGWMKLHWPEVRDFEPNALQFVEPGGDVHAVHYLFSGAEHAVVFVDSIANLDVVGTGRQIRHHGRFQPAGVNVNFVVVSSPNSDPAVIDMRTFEKGVEDETEACGTGSLAAAIVARKMGRISQDRIAINMPGGRLDVGFTETDGRLSEIYQEGPTTFVYRGTVLI